MGIFWTLEPKVGISYPPCFGGPYTRLDYLSKVGLANVVFTQNLTRTSGEKYLEHLPEIGQSMQILATLERRGRLHLALELGALKCDMPVEDGALIIIRGVAPSSNQSRENLLIICPMAVY
jgi:hypothetical protein